MGPRSPRMTFEPTPALERNKENYSPLNDLHLESASAHDSCFDNSRPNKGVHFSDPPSTDPPARRAQSIATSTVPLLQSVASASQLPKHGIKIKPTSPEVDMNAYFEHSRSLLETQRLNHEREKHAFDEERKLWNTERAVLKSRIADLEFKLNKSTGGKRRYSNDSSVAIAQSFRSDFSTFSGFTKNVLPMPSRSSTLPTTNGAPPVWEGPKTTAPATRVFSNDSDPGNAQNNHLTSISEDEASTFPELTQEISPTSKSESVPIPIDKIDSRLDGITIRSTALTPSFVARVMTPTQMASPARSPSPNPRKSTSQSPPSAGHNGTGSNNMSLSMDSLLSPLDEKLKRHAGHTPMAFVLSGARSSTSVSTEIPTPIPREEKPLAPAPTARPPLRPSEDSDTYFSFAKEPIEAEKEAVPEEADLAEDDASEAPGQADPELDADLDADPALQGPLMLDPNNKSSSSASFLDKLDAKLTEAAQARKDSVLSTSTENDSTAKVDEPAAQAKKEEVGSVEAEKDFEMPKLRMKKSTNFGSAYGTDKPGAKW